MNERIHFVNHISRHDAMIVTSAIIAHLSMSFQPYFMVIVILYVFWTVKKFSKLSRFAPNYISPKNVPPRTYFVPLDELCGEGIVGRFFSRHQEKYFTWSFVFFNIIFCPSRRKRRPSRNEEMELIHEFSHCGRGEFILLIFGFLAAFHLIRSPIMMGIFQYKEGGIFYFHATLVLFGLYVMWAAGRMMRRREFIADYLAYRKIGKDYLDYMKYQIDDISVYSPLSVKNSYLKTFFKKIKWHPSWEDRVEFLEKNENPARSYKIDLIGTGLLTALLSIQIPQFMMLPRQTVITWLFFGKDPSRFMGEFAIALFFLLGLWLCWLISRAFIDFKFGIWATLFLIYGIGSAAAGVLLTFVEYWFFDDSRYHIGLLIYPWGASISWVIIGLLLGIIPFLKRDRYLLSFYLFIGLFFGHLLFVYMVYMYENGSLSRSDPYFLSIYSLLLVASAATFAFIVIIPCEVVRRIGAWAARKMLRRGAV